MGQGTVDLPDPLDAQQPGAGNAAGVDDLLAQLAGDEIDRLMAETEKADGSEPAAMTASVPVGVPAPIELPVPSEAEREATAAAENADLEMKATLDALAEDLQPAAAIDATQNVIAPDAVEKILAEAAANDEANRAVAQAAIPQPVPEAATSPAERAALAEPPAIAAPNAGADADPQPDDASIPLWLRPLVFLSSPLDSASPGARDAIGKIAILTTLNAVAVLVYVLIFRRH